jgi:tetratricopeptide (TPR) repeat protein
MMPLPDLHPEGALHEAETLRAGGQWHRAEALLQDSIGRFPANAELLIAWAMVAQHRANWREALQRWAIMRATFPSHPRGYSAAGHALRHLDLCDEADRIEAAGLIRLGDNLELLISHAWTAMVRQDWPEAERRWRIVLALHALSPHGYTGLAEVFAKQHRVAEADAVLREGMAVLPDEAALAEAFAAAASQRQDWPLAVERWLDACARFPASGRCHCQLGVALKQIGQHQTAERILQAALRLAPDDVALAMEHAWCANACNDWPEALRRWRALAARFPANAGVLEGLTNARLNAGEDGDARLPACPVAAPAGEPDHPTELLKNFESLGENCEFGLVQRYFGLEPISLFRWGSIDIGNLAGAIENRVAGLGDPAQTIIGVSPGLEYFVSDTVYKFGIHTFVQQPTIEEHIFLAQQCRRLKFLGRKFLEDVASGEKIFVYAQAGAVDDAAVARLHRALRRHGRVTLLHVRGSDPAHPPGIVEAGGDGLLTGYIERFGKLPSQGWDIAYDSWLSLCRAAAAAHARSA